MYVCTFVCMYVRQCMREKEKWGGGQRKEVIHRARLMERRATEDWIKAGYDKQCRMMHTTIKEIIKTIDQGDRSIVLIFSTRWSNLMEHTIKYIFSNKINSTVQQVWCDVLHQVWAKKRYLQIDRQDWVVSVVRVATHGTGKGDTCISDCRHFY